MYFGRRSRQLCDLKSGTHGMSVWLPRQVGVFGNEAADRTDKIDMLFTVSEIE